MNIENIEVVKRLLGVREKLQLASDLLEAKSARVIIRSGYQEGDLTELFEEELNYSVLDAIAARMETIDKRLSTL